jgi:dCMP deaminase
MARPSIDEYFMEIAKVTAKRATCVRRAVGCVIVDDKNFILSTGYNGVPRASSHCIDTPCSGAHLPSGTGLDSCQAIHAEQNALVRLHSFQNVGTLYCTTEPCVTCAKLILATSCKRVVYSDEYKSSGRLILESAGVEVLQIKV